MEFPKRNPRGAAEVRSPSSNEAPPTKLPTDWGKRVTDWKPGKQAPPGTVIRDGMLFAGGTPPPPPAETLPKPKPTEDDFDNEMVAIVPEELPPGGLSLFIDFADGNGSNPNLVDASLEEQVAQRTAAIEQHEVFSVAPTVRRVVGRITQKRHSSGRSHRRIYQPSGD